MNLFFKKIPDVMEKNNIYIFCFPYAGGNSTVFNKWNQLSEKINFIVGEMPGHGYRMRESCEYDVRKLAQEAAQEIKDVCKNKKFYLYGHSLGALMAFQTAFILENKYGQKPIKLIVSGRHAPCDPDPSEFRSTMGRAALEKELERLDMIDALLLQNKAFMDYLTPIILTDYRMNEEYEYCNEILQIPIEAHYGRSDTEARVKDIERWSLVTKEKVNIQDFEGGHFFIFDKEHRYLNYLMQIIDDGGKNDEKILDCT